jgi:poly-gamma-glutamate capsule biosynthesis protein CapA/YwtB (metallophosphatase superfamily)
MLGGGVAEKLQHESAAYPWGDLLPVLESADLLLANLECALTDRTERWTDGGYKPFYFHANPQHAVNALVAGRVGFVSLANNHIGDFGWEGMQDTLAALDRAGIAHAGAGTDRADAHEPARIVRHSARLSVLAFADYPAEWRATATSPGMNYTPVSLDPEDFTEVARQIAAARERADCVIFSIHWGPNMRAWPSQEFRAFARAVIDAGADIFWGHSAHVVQGVEFHHGHPILYDTGDLVDDYAVDPHLRNDLSALFLVRVRPPVVESVEVVPVQIADMQVHLASGREREWFVHRFRARCAELDVDVAEGGGRLDLTATDGVAAPGDQSGL